MRFEVHAACFPVIAHLWMYPPGELEHRSLSKLLVCYLGVREKKTSRGTIARFSCLSLTYTFQNGNSRILRPVLALFAWKPL